ncbi:DUF4153 domain-containing protein [Clostridia bacterium]|nr:DUF4153 domain-containing protein [Clostridia bacterium]
MANLKSSIMRVIRSSSETFQTYPAVIGCALLFTIVTMVRIQMDWPLQETYNFLFNCLHLAFATGAVFSLAAITAANSRSGEKKAFLYANMLGVIITALTFILLYAFAAREPYVANGIVTNVTNLASARVSAAIAISLIAFIYLAGYPEDESDFGRSLFMFHKAFFIAMIYGLVIMAGTSGVAGAVQALLYRNMSEKVYMYLGTITGFLAFTIFVGYFPSFSKNKIDEHREVAQKQPRFIEVLFQYIMVPIALALTVVLLIWTMKTIVAGSWPSFIRLSGIATSYAGIGIWLHIMVTHHESALAKFFKKIYPIVALVILAFEARVLVVQLGESGLKTPEYYFSLIWVFAVSASILLLIKKEKAHSFIAAILCALILFSVLPGLGYQALPARAQVNRLEELLLGENILQGDKLVPATARPSQSVRVQITDAVEYLSGNEDAKLPTWFAPNLYQNDIFERELGFEKAWPDYDPDGGIPIDRTIETYLALPNGAIDITDYTWAIYVSGYNARQEEVDTVYVEGEQGLYRITWDRTEALTLRIDLDDRLILEEDMKPYLNTIAGKYPDTNSYETSIDSGDLSYELETPEVTVLIVFKDLSVNLDVEKDEFSYWTEINMIYMKENK